MALYNATDMAGAGTPIAETLTAGTAYNLDLNTGVTTPNPNGSNYFTMEQPTNSTGSYMNVASKNFDLATVSITPNVGIVESSLLRSSYKFSVACGNKSFSRIVFTPSVTITSGQVILRSTGNVDLRISTA